MLHQLLNMRRRLLINYLTVGLIMGFGPHILLWSSFYSPTMITVCIVMSTIPPLVWYLERRQMLRLNVALNGLIALVCCAFIVCSAMLWNFTIINACMISVVLICVALLYSYRQVFLVCGLNLMAIAFAPWLNQFSDVPESFRDSVPLFDLHGMAVIFFVINVYVKIFEHANKIQMLRVQRATKRQLMLSKNHEQLHYEQDLMANTINSELQYPVVVINNLSRMMAAAMSEQDDTTALHNLLKTSNKHLLTIFEDFNHVHESTSPMARGNAEWYEIQNITAYVIAVVRQNFIKPGLVFECNVDTRLPQKLLGDPVRISQVLINVFLNTAKYTQCAKLCLEVTPSRDQQSIEFNFVELEVTQSNGERFSNLYNAQQNKQSEKMAQGTPLGLYMARQFVELHNGQMEVLNMAKLGRVLRISLPLIGKAQQMAADQTAHIEW